MMKECEAEYQTHMVSTVFRHMADPESELRKDFNRELEPWREKWSEVLELEELFKS